MLLFQLKKKQMGGAKMIKSLRDEVLKESGEFVPRDMDVEEYLTSTLNKSSYKPSNSEGDLLQGCTCDWCLLSNL
jgi:hypothetical protein